MTRKKRCLAMLLLAIILPLCGITSAAAAPPKCLTILFTHDTHDHFLPMPAEGGGETGGYTRLATALKEQRETPTYLADGITTRVFPVITLDAGDFSMGSLFQTIYATDAPELRALGAMGYDVITLGNHEYDYRAKGLADMLNAAVRSGDPLPAIVQANYRPKPEDGFVQDAFDNYGVTDYTIVERDGLRVAVFGVLGEDADETAPMSNMTFEPIAQAAQRVVTEIREKEDADFIICLSHSGISDNPKQSEDERLAEAVDGIDVIISGHTHSTTREPIQVKDTVTVSCGAYTENLGRLTVVKDNSGVEAADYKLISIDETVTEDPALLAMAEGFKQEVGKTYLADYGLTYDQVLAQSPFDFTPIGALGEAQGEEGLGSLIADAYIHAVKEAEGKAYEPVDFAVVASGVIRASFPKGEITTAQAFDVSSLGSGGDGTPGYPLISVYLTGEELKAAFEVDASVSPLMSTARLYGSGMTWTINPNRMIFNKVTHSAQMLEDGSTIPIEDDRVYRVVTGLYSGQMLGAVNSKSFGLLTITPKDKAGNPVTDFEGQIIFEENGAEVKEWYALASYLKHLGTVPEHYAEPQGRKIMAPSWNPIDLLKNPNWITLTALAVVLLVLVVVVVIVRKIIIRTSKRNRRYNYRGR